MSDIRVAFVMATWHDDLVDRTKLGFFERMAELGHGEDAIDVHKLPGALEFPLHCKKLAQTGNYDVMVKKGREAADAAVATVANLRSI
jgi:6,7-dimethyl-8-ribityllumazine synthase